MRTTFINKLTEFARNDKDVYLITSDTGLGVFEEFKKEFPERYINVGIAEAAMIGMAAGLVLSGKKVFCYAISTFITMRCFEQVRVDLCYQNLPVKLIGVGGGLTYGAAGSTHHTIEDIAVMSSLPNMKVICPGDPFEVEKAMYDMMQFDSPCYLRIGKSGEKLINDTSTEFKTGKGTVINQGSDIAIISTGNMLEVAVEAAQKLQDKGINPEVISMHTIKPVDRELIINTAKKCKNIVSIEEHNIIGGLGSTLSSVITDEELDVKLLKFGIPDAFVTCVGDQDYLRECYGLTVENISSKITEKFGVR